MNDDSNVRARLAEIVQRRIPAEYQEGFIFHAKELFNGGKKPFHRHGGLSLEKRLEIARDLAAIPGVFNLRITVGWLFRTDFMARSPEILAAMSDAERLIGPHLTAYLLCCTHIEQWMRQHAKQEHCVLVYEDNPTVRNRIAELHRAHQDPKIVEGMVDIAKTLFPFHRIVEDPLFQAKRSNSPLELADFCAYVFKRALMTPDSMRFRPFYEQMASSIFEHKLPSP